MNEREIGECFFRMKNALEFYADIEKYDARVEEDMSVMRFDKGRRARSALKKCEMVSKKILRPESKIQKHN